MTRWASVSLLLILVGAACGPSPKPKASAGRGASDGPQPSSTEWLYATPGSSGVVADECKLVFAVLEGEKTCSGDLCQHAVNLGRDWLATCRSVEPEKVQAVEGLLGTFRERSKRSGGDCAFEGDQLIAKGCPDKQDCGVVAQDWATRCSEHASPLVVAMIEKQVESSTRTRINLDTTSCQDMFVKLTATLTCGNTFQCEEKLSKLRDYRARCVDPRVPQPLDRALKEALLVQSAKQVPAPIWVEEAKFPPEKGRLFFEDQSGFVIDVGEQPVPNVSLMIKALRESEYMLPIRIARIFSDPSNRHELRVGTMLVPDAASFFRRFPSLELEGQLEAESSDIANAAIDQLNEVVKVLDRQPSALAGLVKTFAAARDIQDDAEFKAEVEKADKHLARVFQRLAADKRAELPKPHGGGEAMRDRVAYARRSWKQPFADVTTQGNLELGAASPAVQIDVEALLPVSFAAYRDSMDGTIGKALRPLETKYEAELDARAQTLADACVEQRQEMQKLENELLACAFGVKQCEDATVEKTSASLDEAVASHDEMRARLEVALLELAQAPQGKLKQTLAACAR